MFFDLMFWQGEKKKIAFQTSLNNSLSALTDLIVPPGCVAAVWGLISDFHLIQVLPWEGWCSFSVVVQMSYISLCWWFGHVKDELGLRGLIIFGIQGSSGHGGEDELIHLQDECRHEGSMGGLVLHGPLDQYRYPDTLSLREKKGRGTFSGLCYVFIQAWFWCRFTSSKAREFWSLNSTLIGM